MKRLIAVSGGVDSVVLLDSVLRHGQDEVAVAHFDHGIRAESAADARFVAGLACRYKVPYFAKREELGPAASEDTARQRRYQFLFDVAARWGGCVTTAHHQDDVIETIALNLRRGTRWRGLAAMGDQRIERPLLEWTKQDIYDYALRHRLEWVEDATNQSNAYLRNQLRRQLQARLTDQQRAALGRLWRQQWRLRQEIDQEIMQLSPRLSSRYFWTHIPIEPARELLHREVQRLTGVSLLSAQLDRLLIAIKTGRAGTVWQPAASVRVKLSVKSVTIKRVTR
ncbi:tRNA lysidine(34) synthetase TilS [Candidatus Saccharibacteria bacterium oral taxon 488]|nr:tRNA lysidine(34) synthetase TilS [Candidatus Saccharibacteria bacterium oral taxon 488]